MSGSIRTSISFKLGLNYKLTGAPFTRAYHSSPDAPPSHIWDGVYAGVHTGGAFGTTNWKSATGSSFNDR